MRRLKLLSGPILLALACCAITLASGCGGGSSTKITVQIIPGTTQMIDTGESLTFMATLANDTSNKGVMWQFTGSSCSGAGCGTLTNATSSSVLYTAPTGISATLSVSLQAVSLADKSATATVAISVVVAPTFGTALPPNGANGVPYSFAIPVTGGVAPLTLTIASGSLPAGLTISQSGTISGKPTGSNTTNTFTVQVADSGNPPNKVLSPQYTIKISAPPPLSITSSGALFGATVNTAYATSITTSGGVPPFTWSKISGKFPPGLTFNTTSGRFRDSAANGNHTGAAFDHRECATASTDHTQRTTWRLSRYAIFNLRSGNRRRASLHMECCIWAAPCGSQLKPGVGGDYGNPNVREWYACELHARR
jgi:hypothetical protein